MHEMATHSRKIQQDIDELASLVGDILREFESTQHFETVESVRKTALADRRDGNDSRSALQDQILNLDSESASIVARAFATYFELINLAEERERVRIIRAASHEGTLADSLEEAAADLANHPESAQRVLDDVLIEPTFTAHPTEARRKTINAKLRNIVGLLETLDEHRLTHKEEAQIRRQISAEVTSLWQTPQIRKRRPTPKDEARNVRWYLENTLFDVVGEVYGEIENVLAEQDIDVPKLFEFRSWAGSDRDGNPYVTTETTSEVLDHQRRVVTERYRMALKQLSGVLSHDGERIDVGTEFEESLAADHERFPDIAAHTETRYPNEPYRQKLRLMRERLDRIDDVRPGGYDDPGELVEDLQTIRESLVANEAGVIAKAHVEPLHRQVVTFGFSLASLDLRDHRENHTTAVAAAFDRAGLDYDTFSEEERVEILTDAILQEDSIVDLRNTEGLEDTAVRVFDRFRALADWHTEYDEQAIDTYCISMTDEPSHVLEVLFLADQAGVIALPDHCGLDIVPLLETERALSGARRIMGTLFENEAYAQALAVRGDTQEVMLGYSDSNKENGFLAANWDLYTNQRRLAAIADEFDVRLRLFHGRGGSISRGGGPMNEALLALPNETVTGEVKFTEQGEAIAEKYANPRIAERELEQMLNAQIRARLRAIEEPREEISETWVEAMETMADAARAEYRDLLDTAGFVEYFEQATPITVIEELNMGSRPASRSDERTVEDLRAIPWVFSWTQSRCILPGWYALAAGIDAYLNEGGEMRILREMYAEWSFFRTTLDNAAFALARTDMKIAAEYAGLARTDLREQFFERLNTEYERATLLVKQITGRDDLLARKWLRESLLRRNPYVDPLNYLQVELLGRTDRTERTERTLRLTVKGIAAGMKNTG